MAMRLSDYFRWGGILLAFVLTGTAAAATYEVGRAFFTYIRPFQGC
jgi:hypothetical protein